MRRGVKGDHFGALKYKNPRRKPRHYHSKKKKKITIKTIKEIIEKKPKEK